MTEEELLAEEYICNGKCQDDITRNYVHCKTCTRLKDFLAGYKVGKTDLEKENAVLEKRIERAKECMKKLLFIINSDPANYNCKGLVRDAEDFIYNRTCNIRRQGQHCISETRCIMCDKEIKENDSVRKN